MKKCFFYAGALAMLLSSCSNDDTMGPGGPVQQGGAAVESLKVSLVSGAETRSTENGVGAENTLSESYLFVENDENGPDPTTKAYEYKYKFIKLGAGQNSTVVKWVKPNSKVYVVANAPYMDDTLAESFVSGANTPDAAGTPEDIFIFSEFEIAKNYIVGLNATTGKFMMTGKGVVPAANGTSATVLSVPLKRDLAKVDFKIKKGGTDGDKTVEVLEIQEVTIRRSADQVQPFAMNGGVSTSYVLPYGVGNPLYKQDGLQADGTTFAPNNTSKTEGATDYSFIYGSSNFSLAGDLFTLNPIYVLPNAAKVAEKGTIIVVKAKVKTTPADGVSSATSTEAVKYYKARISSGMEAYSTDQNAKYSITATIKGAGHSVPTGPTGPDVENTENDLNIDVRVEPWSLIISNQEIG